MDIYDNESEIIRAFQNIAPSSVMFAPECTSESEALFLCYNKKIKIISYAEMEIIP